MWNPHEPIHVSQKNLEVWILLVDNRAGSFKHVQKCHLYQIYADKMNQPPTPLHNMTSSWPFSMWGIDAIGMVHPKASNQHWFILAIIDCFTKWVEATSFANLSKKQVIRLIKNIIICRYGLPYSIIMIMLRSSKMMIHAMCMMFSIHHQN